jgi:hypothetical protein
MTRLGPWVPLVLALAVSVALVVIPRVAPPSGALAAIGPLAWTWIWLPTTLWAVAALLDATGSRASLVRAVRAGARASVWLLLALILLDPAPNAPDHVAVATGSGWRSLIGQLRPVLVGIVGLVILGAIAGSLLGGGEAPPPSNRKTVTTGSTVGPVTGMVLRGALRLCLWGIRTMLDLVWVAVAWTIDGLDGIRALRRQDDDPGDAVALVARGRDLTRRATGWTGVAVGRASAGWGRRSEHGVWLLPAALERDAEGEVIVTDWPDRGLTPEHAALRELGLGLLAAYDVAISSGSGGGRGRGAPDSDGGEPGAMRQRTASRPAPHRIEIARAWTRPGLVCLVLRATPASAATAMAKVGPDSLLPSLDATTGWTLEDLRGLRLSDRRVADDELRGGEAGLFIALETSEPDAEEAAAESPDAARTAIERALREAGLGGTFRHAGTDDAWDATTVEYAARIRDAADWRRLEEGWRALGPAVSVYLRMPGVRMEARLESRRFICTVPKPALEFPPSADWDAVIAAHPPTRRHRMRAIVAHDQRGEPVRIDLGPDAPAPHWLIAGSTGSGKSSFLQAWLASLLEANRTDQLRLWILDSPKRELARAFEGAPQVARVTIAEDAEAIIETLTAFVATMDERYRRLDGRPIDRDREPVLLLVIEEWATMSELLDRRSMETVLRLAARTGAVGRAASTHLAVVSQRAGVDTVPARLRVHLAGRAVGYLSTVSEYQAALGVSRRVLPNVRGRMAISVDGQEITIAQAVHLPPERLRARVAEWQRRERTPTPERPGALLDGLELPEDESVAPRAPRAAEVLGMDLLTVTRLLIRWQAEQSAPLVVSVRGLIGRVRELGYPTGRVESYTAALARLEELGVLEPVADHPTAARRLAMDWTTARAAVTVALEPGRDRRDPVYPELYP